MLQKAERINRSDFLSFFKRGKRFHSGHLQAVVCPFPTFHGAVVVSKKVSKLAVVRNTIRRRLYPHLAQLKPLRLGVVIITVKPGFAALSQSAMHEEMKLLIERLQKSA